MSEHAKRGHAELGGSGADRWMNCPGSIILQRELPEQEASEAMLEGTQAHEYAEQFLSNFLNYKVTGEQREFTWVPSDEMCEHIHAYRDFIWKELLEESITDKAYDLETPITIDEQLQMWGSADFWSFGYDDRGKRVAIICDLKYGRQDVDAEDNAQLAFYAVALREELRKHGMDVDYVVAAIFQPRSFSNPKPKKTKWTAKQLDAWKKKFYKAAHAIYVKQKPSFKVGEWCKQCRAKSICKKYAREAEVATTLKLVDVETVTVPAIETLPKETIAKIALNYDLVKDFLDGCFDYTMREAKVGTMPGIKVVEASKGKRSWSVDTDLVVSNLMAQGLTPEEITVPKLKGIGEIEKSLKTLVSKEALVEIMNDITVKGKSTETIVALTDPRPAILGAQELLSSSPIEGITGDVFINKE